MFENKLTDLYNMKRIVYTVQGRRGIRKMTGKVKKFDKDKGYGFIKIEDGRDVFFHFSQIVMEGYKTIDPDSQVEFDLVETERGLQAHNIKKIA